MFEALRAIRETLPFVLLGLDSDNGAEFINAHLLAYCTTASSSSSTWRTPSRLGGDRTAAAAQPTTGTGAACGEPPGTAVGMTEPVSPRGAEYRYSPALGRTCPEHVGCLLIRCDRFLYSRLVHRGPGPGQPRRFCSPACRVAEHRRLRG